MRPLQGADEAAELLLGRSPSPGGLLLEGAEQPELAPGIEHTLDGRDAQSPDQLVLEVGDAHVEAESLHVRPGEVGAEARPFEGAHEVALLALVAEARDPEPESLRAEPAEGVADRLRTADRHDLDALGGEVASPALGERLERALVADPLDEHDRARGWLSPGALRGTS